MTIHQYQAQFEETMRRAASSPQVTEQAWNYFKDSIKRTLSEEYCEEIGFVASVHEWYDGKKLHRDETLFSVYFGRLIDNERRRGANWNVAEIDCYFLYEMSEELSNLNAHLQKVGFQIEDAYCKADANEAIQRKIEAIFTFADERTQLWDAIRELVPIKVNYNFSLY